MHDRHPAERRGTAWWYLLLVIPFIAMLWVPSCASGTPAIGEIPFFYWYQFLWVIISAVLTAIVYLATRSEDSHTAG